MKLHFPVRQLCFLIIDENNIRSYYNIKVALVIVAVVAPLVENQHSMVVISHSISKRIVTI